MANDMKVDPGRARAYALADGLLEEAKAENPDSHMLVMVDQDGSMYAAVCGDCGIDIVNESDGEPHHVWIPEKLMDAFARAWILHRERIAARSDKKEGAA